MKSIECDIHAAISNLYTDPVRISILLNKRMLQILKTFILTNCICLITIALFAQKTSIDVQSYELTIEPHIQKGSIEGEVLIRFKVVDNTKSITINAGNLEIDEFTGTSILSFRKVDSRVIIELSDLRQPEHEMVIVYHGRPKRGIHFNSELNQAHTVYFTDHWMVCNNSPDDRATFSLQILLPEGMQSIASGKFLGTEGMADKVIHKWEQDYETPSYTYGFVIGTFNKATDQVNDVNLSYHSSELEEHELKKVYKETASMLEFFEQKSGVPYIQDTYAQIVIGTNYQEMSSLSVFSKSYTTSVLKDSSEIHLTAHELAHQW